MTTVTTPSSLALVPSLETAWQDVDSSFERFCLTAGIKAIEQRLCDDAQQLAGAPHNRGRRPHRPPLGQNQQDRFPWWQGCRAAPARWAMNLMLMLMEKARESQALPKSASSSEDADRPSPLWPTIETCGHTRRTLLSSYMNAIARTLRCV